MRLSGTCLRALEILSGECRRRCFYVDVYIRAVFGLRARLGRIDFFFGSLQPDILLAVMIICSFLILAVLYLRWGFVWFVLYDDPSLSVRQALRKALYLRKKKRIAFVLFCVQSGGLYLLCAALVLIFRLHRSFSIFGPVAVF